MRTRARLDATTKRKILTPYMDRKPIIHPASESLYELKYCCPGLTVPAINWTKQTNGSLAVSQSVDLDILTVRTVVGNIQVMSFHWNSSSAAAPALLTLQFEIQPQEALMCFQVNNFPRSALRGDLLISVLLRKRQGITQRYKNTVRNYVHPFSIGEVKQF